MPDPARRKLYDEMDTHFGMQGGFNRAVNIIPYLGVRWVISSHGLGHDGAKATRHLPGGPRGGARRRQDTAREACGNGRRSLQRKTVENVRVVSP